MNSRKFRKISSEKNALIFTFKLKLNTGKCLFKESKQIFLKSRIFFSDGYLGSLVISAQYAKAGSE